MALSRVARRRCSNSTASRIHLLSPAALLEANEDRLLADYGAMSQARLLHLEEHREERN
jgi:hypothetical protein